MPIHTWKCATFFSFHSPSLPFLPMITLQLLLRQRALGPAFLVRRTPHGLRAERGGPTLKPDKGPEVHEEQQRGQTAQQPSAKVGSSYHVSDYLSKYFFWGFWSCIFFRTWSLFSVWDCWANGFTFFIFQFLSAALLRNLQAPPSCLRKGTASGPLVRLRFRPRWPRPFQHGPEGCQLAFGICLKRSLHRVSLHKLLSLAKVKMLQKHLGLSLRDKTLSFRNRCWSPNTSNNKITKSRKTRDYESIDLSHLNSQLYSTHRFGDYLKFLDVIGSDPLSLPKTQLLEWSEAPSSSRPQRIGRLRPWPKETNGWAMALEIDTAVSTVSGCSCLKLVCKDWWW